MDIDLMRGIEPLVGMVVDRAIFGPDILKDAEKEENVLFYYNGPLLWLITLPDGRQGLAFAADQSEDQLTDVYVIYLYDNMEDVNRRLKENCLLRQLCSEARTIYMVAWRMHKDDYRCLDARSVYFTQLEEDGGRLPSETATLR